MTPPFSDNPFFAGFSEEQLSFIGSVASPVAVEAGRNLFCKGENAGHFYLLRSGTMVIQVPTRDDGIIPLMTLNPGEILGWSWLFPPYQWNFDAQALNDCELTGFATEALRKKCEEDHDFGYLMMRSLVLTMHDRLTATRLQLLRHHDE